jgi:hypothetical protein
LHRKTDPSKLIAPDLDPTPARPIILAPMRTARVGLVNCGLSLMATAWETMDFAWEVDSHRSLMRRYAPNRPTPKGWDTVARTPTNLLDRYPVDVLDIKRSEESNRIRSTLTLVGLTSALLSNSISIIWDCICSLPCPSSECGWMMKPVARHRGWTTTGNTIA